MFASVKTMKLKENSVGISMCCVTYTNNNSKILAQRDLNIE